MNSEGNPTAPTTTASTHEATALELFGAIVGGPDGVKRARYLLRVIEGGLRAVEAQTRAADGPPKAGRPRRHDPRDDRLLEAWYDNLASDRPFTREKFCDIMEVEGHGEGRRARQLKNVLKAKVDTQNLWREWIVKQPPIAHEEDGN